MAVTEYIWDVESDNVLQETDDLGATTATYTNEPDEFGGLVSQNRGGAESYYHFDALGSTRELTDDTETVTDTNMYDAWGVDVASSGTTENPFRWVGRLGYHFDEGTGEYYVRARRYESLIARWRSKDPIGLGGHDANLYRYVDGTPADASDASGLAVDTDFWICSCSSVAPVLPPAIITGPCCYAHLMVVRLETKALLAIYNCIEKNKTKKKKVRPVLACIKDSLRTLTKDIPDWQMERARASAALCAGGALCFSSLPSSPLNNPVFPPASAGQPTRHCGRQIGIGAR